MLLFDHWHHRVREQSSQRELLRRRRVAVGVNDSLTVVTPSDPRKTVRGWLPYPDVPRVNVKDMGPMWNDVACVRAWEQLPFWNLRIHRQNRLKSKRANLQMQSQWRRWRSRLQLVGAFRQVPFSHAPGSNLPRIYFNWWHHLFFFFLKKKENITIDIAHKSIKWIIFFIKFSFNCIFFLNSIFTNTT